MQRLGGRKSLRCAALCAPQLRIRTLETFDAPLVREERYGGGGRSSISGVVATVFGASGHLGRYVVNALGRQGSQVIVPFRGEANDVRHLKLMGDLGQIVPIKYDIRDVASIRRALCASNVVVNCIGTERPTSRFSLDDANRKVARLVARVAREEGVQRFIQVSDVRADKDSPSEYARAKAAAEEEVAELFPGATVVRLAPLMSSEDRLTIYYAQTLRNLPFVPMVAPEYEVQPLYAGDAANGINAAVQNPFTRGATIELAGPETFTHMQLLENVGELILKEEARVQVLSPRVASLLLRVGDRLPKFRPRITEQDALMRTGKPAVLSGDANVETFETLEVKEPTQLRTVSTLWLRRFREPDIMNQVVVKDDTRLFIHGYDDIVEKK